MKFLLKYKTKTTNSKFQYSKLFIQINRPLNSLNYLGQFGRDQDKYDIIN